MKNFFLALLLLFSSTSLWATVQFSSSTPWVAARWNLLGQVGSIDGNTLAIKWLGGGASKILTKNGSSSCFVNSIRSLNFSRSSQKNSLDFLFSNSWIALEISPEFANEKISFQSANCSGHFEVNYTFGGENKKAQAHLFAARSKVHNFLGKEFLIQAPKAPSEDLYKVKVKTKKRIVPRTIFIDERNDLTLFLGLKHQFLLLDKNGMSSSSNTVNPQDKLFLSPVLSASIEYKPRFSNKKWGVSANFEQSASSFGGTRNQNIAMGSYAFYMFFENFLTRNTHSYYRILGGIRDYTIDNGTLIQSVDDKIRKIRLLPVGAAFGKDLSKEWFFRARGEYSLPLKLNSAGAAHSVWHASAGIGYRFRDGFYGLVEGSYDRLIALNKFKLNLSSLTFTAMMEL